MQFIRYSFVALTLFFSNWVQAQNTPTTNIRGTVIDKQSQFPIVGATVIVIDIQPVKGTSTDEQGRFRLEGLPTGRHTIEVKYVGYEPMLFSNVLLNSGKDLELNVQLLESIQELNSIEIIAEQNKSESINKMSTVSSRSFSIDEAMRYSGTLQDPSRMAQNYAGVSGASDDRNDIIIRGNSPTGVLWRMEGIDIPSPNHFATLGTTGGPISILNINNLANSDFATSAFAAEYGNAMAGVFDLRLRTGNQGRREYTGQMGFNGLEFGMEGPFKKGGNATYIANYRYSFLGIMKSLGINFGTGNAIPEYQDLTFKIDVPTERFGRFTVFGIGGVSFIDFKSEDAGEANLYSNDSQNSLFSNQTGVVGASHTYFFNDKTFGKFIAAGTTARNYGYIDTLDLAFNPHRFFGTKNEQNTLNAHYFINSKINSKNTLKVGVMGDRYIISVSDSIRIPMTDSFFMNRDDEESMSLLRAYAQWQWRPAEKWTLNSGLYGQYLLLNDTYTIEPRVGAKYAINKAQALSVGLGMHSQMQPIPMYFTRERLDDGSFVANNESLDFNRSLHAVLAYDYQFTPNTRLKSEVYYQYLYNIAVERNSSSFSVLNSGADFVLPIRGDLVNEGTGYNYGLEITLERFLNKGYYYLFTASLFESKYEGSDGIERNTAFNGNYVFNFLAGKEWQLNERMLFTFDFKLNYAGGRRYTPIDLTASQAENTEVRDRSQDFSLQYDPYFRADVKFGFRFNMKRISQSIMLDIRNVTNNKNVFALGYDRYANEIQTTYQTGFFPVVLYTVYF